MKRLVSGRIFFDLFLLAAAGLGTAQSLGLPPSHSPSQVSAGFFPSVVLGIGCIVMLAVLWQDIRSAVRSQAAKSAMNRKAAACFGLILVLLLVYVSALEAVGFLIGTIVFLTLGSFACGSLLPTAEASPSLARLALASFAIAAATTLLTYFAFTEGFGLIFP